jgi:peptidoglycan/xylan/chitin deacetylase (PgdA/CDA1 family)
MYHSLDVSRLNEYAVVEPDIFRRQMEFLKKGGYKVIPLEEYCQALADKKDTPRGTVIITFDDGYLDNLEAIKILKKYDYSATIFLVNSRIGKKGFLSKEDIEFFLANTRVKIGSHTLSHAYLPDLDAGQIRKEIFESKKNLSKNFKQDIKSIAYPIGAFNEETLQIARDSDYLCACTTNRGFSKTLNRFALRRVKITNRDLGIRLWAKASGFYNIFKKVKKPF